MALHGELAVLGDIVLQIGMVHALEQFFKRLGGKLSQHHHDPLAGTQADICLGQSSLVTGKENSAILHPHIFHIQPAQLVTGDTFQTKQTRNNKLHIRNSLRDDLTLF